MKNNIVGMSQRGWKDLKITSSFSDLYQNAIRARFILKSRGKKEIEITQENMREELYLRINSYLLKRKMVSDGALRCSVYISMLAKEVDFLGIEETHMVDYCLDSFSADSAKLSFEKMKRNADNFFIACAVFPELMRRDELSQKNCKEIGESLYWELSHVTCNAIYTLMSFNFDVMVGIVRECLSETWVKFPSENEAR